MVKNSSHKVFGMEEGRPVREAVQRIAFEMQEAGATKWQAIRVLKELEQFQGNEQQLRKRAFEAMEKLNPGAAGTFISFERMKVFTSKEKRERFDRGNIIKSLLRETKVSRAVAEKIGSEVEDRIKDLKIEYLNTPLIREMVSSKLLEYGHEPVHREYSRIGMPVFEVGKRLEAWRFDNPEIMREYAWLSLITGRAREMHFDSLIHIFYPEDFATKIFCAPKFFEGEVEDMAVSAKELDNICSVPSTAAAWNFSLADAGATEKKSGAAASAEKIFSLTKGRRVAELALFADFGWKEKSHLKKKAVQTANRLIGGASDSFSYCVSVDSRYQLKLLGSAPQEKITAMNNSRSRVVLYDWVVAVGNNSGLLHLVGINLEKIAQTAGDEKGFFSLLEEVTETISSLSAHKRQLLSKRNYIEKWAAEETSTGVCLAGLLRASRALSQDNPSKAAEGIIAGLQKEGFMVMEMPEHESRHIFEIIGEKGATQEMLLGHVGQKARNNYGFAYAVSSLKDAEALLGDVPCVEVVPQAPPEKRAGKDIVALD